jgi:hypothetical protein
MGNFNRVRRVQTSGEDWIDIRPLTVAESREFDAKAREVTDTEEAANLRIDLVLSHIVAWSDDVPVSEEQARELDIALVWRLFERLTGMEDAEVPLPTGSDSTAT